jgi:nucleoside-diphosphate-sugar epimerase
MTEAKNIPLFDLAGSRVYVAGHAGMVGAALVRRLRPESCTILTVDHALLDLTRQAETEQWIDAAKPDAVILAAAKVGGIAFNDSYPVDFLSDNLAIALNVIRASYAAGVKKLLFLGSSCIYPKLAPQPMDEGMLLTGPLEPTNQWYAVAKIAGIKLVEALRQQYGADFISVMPTNLYGPGDNYHPEHSHVPAALIRRLHEAKLAGAIEQYANSHFLEAGDHANRLVIAQYPVHRFPEMGPQSFHARKRIIKRPECRASIVSRYRAYVVFQIWEEFFQASHRAFIHINVEITDMKQGEAIEGAR